MAGFLEKTAFYAVGHGKIRPSFSLPFALSLLRGSERHVCFRKPLLLVANNITMQFGAKPLFENVSVKFGEGHRYGLIGANGAGKSTFMRILAGVLEPSAGNVVLDNHERMAFLRQDQFAFEDQRVIDVVLQGHAEMWACMQEKDAIYANP